MFKCIFTDGRGGHTAGQLEVLLCRQLFGGNTETDVIRKMQLLMCIVVCLGTTSAEFPVVTGETDITVDTVTTAGCTYSVLSVPGFQTSITDSRNTGYPCLPWVSRTFLLEPDTGLDTVLIVFEEWRRLPGKYCLHPLQSGFSDGPAFCPPSMEIYGSSEFFPKSPFQIYRQGSAMGYSVASIRFTPFRYSPKDSSVEYLHSLEVELLTSPSETERVVPARESPWSRSMRTRGISAMVVNPEMINSYSDAVCIGRTGSTALSVEPKPSTQGDCVDMVIITDSYLESSFQELADYRSSQGIVTVVRTVEWIEDFYGGCDTPQKIRNFLRDAVELWGIQAVLMGGDDGIVPVRECAGWDYGAYPAPTFQMPSDDYYADVDGQWSLVNSRWCPDEIDSYLDLCAGRWPVNSPEEFRVMFDKLKSYEIPTDFPEDFSRKLLMMAVNEINGTAASDMIRLADQLSVSGAVPEYLDEPTQLYFPHTLPQGDLCRTAALQEMDEGFNLILHADHAEVHKMATAGRNTLGEYMWDSDFATLGNQARPSILWTLGCSPGQFDGARCFVEAGLLEASGAGFVSAIANARYGIYDQSRTYYVFFDALLDTHYLENNFGYQSLHWPLSYLGEAHRCSKNVDAISYVLLNLLGSPLLSVWRGEPVPLDVSLPPIVMVEGVPSDLTVSVTAGEEPVEN
ncbi:MAG: hypothetical protein GF388_04135, partial [Candidatus Aegiribacteria sp.]|nr:hypothetical protein [Candidatus Aegiribacteria sp.]MBD3294429.1 hypothetical protein [Candidatus Fermentibacteria bacterium]